MLVRDPKDPQMLAGSSYRQAGYRCFKEMKHNACSKEVIVPNSTYLWNLSRPLSSNPKPILVVQTLLGPARTRDTVVATVIYVFPEPRDVGPQAVSYCHG